MKIDIKQLQEFIRKHNGSIFTLGDIKPGDILICYYNNTTTAEELSDYCDMISGLNLKFPVIFVPDRLRFEVISVFEGE